jgi:hypothetical protein
MPAQDSAFPILDQFPLTVAEHRYASQFSVEISTLVIARLESLPDSVRVLAIHAAIADALKHSLTLSPDHRGKIVRPKSP